MQSRAQAALRLGGVCAWLSALALLGAGTLLGERGPWNLPAAPRGVWFAAFALFGLAYWGATDFARSAPRRRACCAAMSACAAVCTVLLPSNAMAMLFILTAAILPGVLPWPLTLAWVGAHCAVLALALLRGSEATVALSTGLNAGVGQLAAALLVHLAGAEMAARRELAEQGVRLRFAHALLQNATREAERARISRELHDALGHHLTVLGLELEFAAHVAGGEEARSAVERARALNRLLLAEVRATVGALRGGRVEWDHLTREALGSVPGLDVHVALAPDLGGAGAGCTQAVLRFMQEVVTNAVRHAGARNVWFDLTRHTNELVVQARDDGGLRAPPTPGNGLTGLRERFEELGGTLRYGPGPGGGLHLEARVPLEPA